MGRILLLVISTRGCDEGRVIHSVRRSFGLFVRCLADGDDRGELRMEMREERKRIKRG